MPDLNKGHKSYSPVFYTGLILQVWEVGGLGVGSLGLCLFLAVIGLQPGKVISHKT